MARSSAERRLLRILNNEDYGPKLARLRGEDERYILRLIDQNEGRLARREILRLDEERRARERARRQERKRRAIRREPTTGRSRKERERRAIANILAQFQGLADRRRVAQNVRHMDDEELDFAAHATAQSLRLRAVRRPDRRNNKGEELNPFWYH